MVSFTHLATTVPILLLKWPLGNSGLFQGIEGILLGAGYQALAECGTKINLRWYGNRSKYFKKKNAPLLSHVVMATKIRKVTWPRRLCAMFFDWELSEKWNNNWWAHLLVPRPWLEEGNEGQLRIDSPRLVDLCNVAGACSQGTAHSHAGWGHKGYVGKEANLEEDVLTRGPALSGMQVGSTLSCSTSA